MANLTTAITTTVLPCSSYLSAQSAYLDLDDPTNVDDIHRASGCFPWDWQKHFGRSPECKSFAQAYSSSEYTISGCGSRNTLISSSDLAIVLNENDPFHYTFCPTMIPPGVVRQFSPDYLDSCCGGCKLDAAELSLYYFPDKSSAECQHNETLNSTSTLLSASLGKRVQSIAGDGSIAIVNRQTL